MQAVCAPFDPISRKRITQLINKTNQFNLTTRRYTEADVEAFERSAGLTLQVRLIDRFGDNGMVAVVICREMTQDWIIDTWLMSCRVLRRQLERAMLNHLVAQAKAAGVRALIGEYLRTDRNAMVRGHYEELGFEPLSLDETRSRWRLDVAGYVAVPVPMEIVSSVAVETHLRLASA